MALQSKYLAFLAHPSPDALASAASIHYVPTLTSISDATGILKHISSQQQVVSKKDEKILSAFESNEGLCVETDTTLQFVNGGGTYLPGLDDNFLADKVVNIVIMHVVTFDANQKILQIRLHWDQASLLKAVDTIGARGRNWPINLGKDQARLIMTSAATAPQPAGLSDAEAERTGRSLSRGVDPHSSLALFAPRDPNAHSRGESQSNVVAPRESARPPPREWGELFASGESEVGAAERSPSPSKLDNPIKAGAGKNYKDIRVFNPDADAPTNKGIKTDVRKYQHFEFGEAEFSPSPVKNERTKHMSQWDFSDFMTPAKTRQRPTASHTRNFDFTEFGNEAEAEKPLVWTQHHPQPRQDAASHFDITDSTPKDEKPERAFISRNSQSKVLYHDPVFGGNDEADSDKPSAEEQAKQPLGNITNTNVISSARHATFESHWETTDAPSPVGNENDGKSSHVSEATKKVVKGMEAGWNLYDDSPQQPEKQSGIKILGNGTGSSKVADKGWWDY